VLVHDRGNLVFELEDSGNSDLTHDDLAHRYQWAGNQLLVDEAIESLTDTELNESRWALPDHLGTIRDWIDDDANVLDHAVYDSYGQRTDTPAIETSIEWTGMYRDSYTGLQLHGKRWYNPEILAAIRISTLRNRAPLRTGFLSGRSVRSTLISTCASSAATAGPKSACDQPHQSYRELPRYRKAIRIRRRAE
jgi:hypothetical protein